MSLSELSGGIVRIAALAGLALGSLACDDGDGTGVDLTGFEPEAVTDGVNVLLESTARLDTATYSLRGADSQLGFWEGGGLTDAAADAAATAPFPGARRTAPAGPTLPVDFGDALGKTYLFSLASSQWEIDPDANDAPEDAVRVRYYRVDVGGVAFVTPLDAIGYIDLTDLDTPEAERLGMTVVSTSTGTDTISELTQSFVTTETATGYTEHAEADGYYTGTAGTVELSMGSELSAIGSTGSQDIETAFEMAFHADDVTFIWDVESFEEGTGGDYTTDLAITLTHQGVATVLSLGVVGNSIQQAEAATGTITHGGVLVANLALDGGRYRFSSPDGEAFRSSDQNRMQTMLQSLVIGGLLLLDSVPILFFTPVI